MANEVEDQEKASWHGSVLISGVGLASVLRIPIPGTSGLCVQFDAPGRYKGSTSSIFFVEDPSAKFGRQLRLDFGERPTTVKGKKVIVIDYHWNQKGTIPNFGIPDHSPANNAAKLLYQGAK